MRKGSAHSSSNPSLNSSYASIEVILRKNLSFFFRREVHFCLPPFTGFSGKADGSNQESCSPWRSSEYIECFLSRMLFILRESIRVTENLYSERIFKRTQIWSSHLMTQKIRTKFICKKISVLQNLDLLYSRMIQLIASSTFNTIFYQHAILALFWVTL